LVTNQQGYKAGLPIVDMHDFRSPRQKAGEMRDALGKENEPLAIIRVIPSVFLIK